MAPQDPGAYLAVGAAGVSIGSLGADFFKGLVGAEEQGKALRERVISYLTPHTKKIVEDATKLLGDIGETPQEITPKRLLPILAAASVEDDPELQARWAALIANESRARDVSRHNYAALLEQMTVMDAVLLDVVAGREPMVKSLSVFNRSRWIGWSNRMTGIRAVMARFPGRPSTDVDASIDNLVRLGLVRVEPLSELDPAVGHTHPGEDPDVIELTMLGLYFISATRPPQRAESQGKP